MFMQEPQGEPHFKSSVCFLELQVVCNTSASIAGASVQQQKSDHRSQTVSMKWTSSILKR